MEQANPSFPDINGTPVHIGDTVILRSRDNHLEWYENNLAYHVSGYDAAERRVELTNDYFYAECSPGECEKFERLEDFPDRDAAYATYNIRTAIDNLSTFATYFSSSRSVPCDFRWKVGAMSEWLSTQFELALAEACRQP